MEEFVKCGKQSKQLQEIPVLLITDYNVSLYGAVVAAQLRKKGEL
jgi:glucokinase